MCLVCDCVCLIYDCVWSVIQVTGHFVSVTVLERVGLGTLCDQLLELVRRVRQLRLDANEYICLKYIVLLNSGNHYCCCHDNNKVVPHLVTNCSWGNRANRYGRFFFSNVTVL